MRNPGRAGCTILPVARFNMATAYSGQWNQSFSAADFTGLKSKFRSQT